MRLRDIVGNSICESVFKDEQNRTSGFGDMAKIVLVLSTIDFYSVLYEG
jgi:hypothetical protein